MRTTTINKCFNIQTKIYYSKDLLQCHLYINVNNKKQKNEIFIKFYIHSFKASYLKLIYFFACRHSSICKIKAESYIV